VNAQPWPDLPESIVEWPSAAAEYVIVLNRSRRASGQPETNANAARTIAAARAWWRCSTAHEWPELGKWDKALESGIEAALQTLRCMGAKLRPGVSGALIVAPVMAPHEDLAEALTALRLSHLEVVQAEAVAA